jgi:glycerol-3-phosphate dehydrogenase (NAD(P)+)
MTAQSNAMSYTVAVIGGGRWARALHSHLEHRHARAPERIARVLQVREAEKGGSLEELAAADLLILAVPATVVRPLLRQAAPFLNGGQLLVHAVGSLAPVGDDGSRALISEVVRAETPLRRVGALAGPALALDLEERRPGALVCGSRFDEVCAAAVEALSSPSLLVYTTRDQVGVEVARAMVSVVALAGGIASALELGPAARSVLIARGAAEMARLGVALGASERTFFGLAGVGELVVATDGRGSADFELGCLLGKGSSLDAAQKQVGRVCDAPGMIEEAQRLARVHRLRLPLTAMLDHVLRGERTSQDALAALFVTHNHSE